MNEERTEPQDRSRSYVASLQKRARSETGQSIVEFALVIPLLLIFLLGVLDFGRGVVAYVALAESAREGARAGLFPTSTDAEIRIAARAQAAALGNIPDSDIVITPAYPRQSGDTVQVTVFHDYNAITPAINAIWGGGSLRMTGLARMKVE